MSIRKGDHEAQKKKFTQLFSKNHTKLDEAEQIKQREKNVYYFAVYSD